MSKTQGYIIIRHALLRAITEQETEDVIEKAYPDSKSKFKQVEIRSITKRILQHKELNQLQWKAEARYHQQIVEVELLPLIEQYPDYKIIYFGAAPVALATHLGSLLGTWTKVEVFLTNHKGEQEWYQQNPSSAMDVTEVQTLVEGVPKDKYKTQEDIAITVATSYEIDYEVFQASITRNIVKEISLSTSPIVLDLPGVTAVYEVADQFSTTLNQVARNLPEIETIHLVTAVPVGLAFLLGTKVSANVQAPLQLYQFINRTDGSKYMPVLKIGQPIEDVLVLTDEQKEAIVEQKQTFVSQEWEQLQNWLDNEEPEGNYWLSDFKKDMEKATLAFDYYFWKKLPAIHTTPLPNTRFSVEKELLVDFEFVEQERWQVGNVLWYRMREALENDEERFAYLFFTKVCIIGNTICTKQQQTASGVFPRYWNKPITKVMFGPCGTNICILEPTILKQ